MHVPSLNLHMGQPSLQFKWTISFVLFNGCFNPFVEHLGIIFDLVSSYFERIGVKVLFLSFFFFFPCVIVTIEIKNTVIIVIKFNDF